MLSEDYLETARMLHRAVLRITDHKLADQIIALAEAYARRAEKAAQAGAAKALAREEGIKSSSPQSRSRARVRAARAAQLAETALEKIEDRATLPLERVQRRRKLTKGPSEFREDRIDQPLDILS